MDNGFDALMNVAAVPQDDKVAAFVAESKNNRNRCYELSEAMTVAVATDGQKLQQYLDMQSRFDRYTTNNVLLIMAQRPDAEKIGDYGYWKDKGAYIKRTERNNPILILVPGKEREMEDGSKGTYYNAKKVYDIMQTTLTEKTQPIQTQAAIDEKLLIRALISNPPACIQSAAPDQMPEDKGAIFEPEENCIYVRTGMNAQEIFRSLTPELAHAGFAEKMMNMTVGIFLFMLIVHLICFAKNMELIHRDLISAMLQNILTEWKHKRSEVNFQKPVKRLQQFHSVWRKCSTRTGYRIEIRSRHRAAEEKQDEGSKIWIQF